MSKSIDSILESIRECDKKIIKFIMSNGGCAFEKDIRLELNEPRTTIWRSIRRLEEQGIISVTKQNHHNLVKLSNFPFDS